MSETKKAKLTFFGGTDTVTGANFLFETLPPDGETPVKILVDCGLEQGTREATKRNWDHFGYDVGSIDYLFITHAHIDHIGRVPHLVKKGFKGKIFSTPETKMLAPIMLADSAKLLEEEAERAGLTPLYGAVEIENAMSLWHEIPYHTETSLKGGLSVYAKDAGHILGSAIYEFTYNGSIIAFTGDLGNSPTPILRDTEAVTKAKYLIMESVYGDRNHETSEERQGKLEDVIEDIFASKGVLLIPSFSLEKTQVILYEMNKLMEGSRVPQMPVYLDSPLAIKVTDIYREYNKNFNKDARKEIQTGDDIFHFKNLSFVKSTEESKKIIDSPNPKIIIAGSGMSTGGRIVHHEANYLPDPKSILLLIGYQTLGTLGRRIQNGEKEVSIYGKKVPIRAKVVTIDGYSSHKDMDHLIEFVAKTRDFVKTVFPVMGEPKASLHLAQRLSDYLGVYAYQPKVGESVDLEF